MKEIPMLYSTPMVQALLEGRKTMTRREVKFPSDFDGKEIFYNGKYGLKYTRVDDTIERIFPKYNVGDLIWVRETFQKREGTVMPLGLSKYYFKAGWKGCTDLRWKPSIHMPKEAARIWLRVTNVRVERLQNITEDDAIAEGVSCRMNPPVNPFMKPFRTYYDYMNAAFPSFGVITASKSFSSLWKSINGEQSFQQNPWVWVVEFEVVSTTGKANIKT